MRKTPLFLIIFLPVFVSLLGCLGPNKEEFQNIANLLNSKQYSSAISTLNELGKKYPGNARIYYYLGYAYLNNKDYNNALKNLRKAHQLKPKFKWVIGDTSLANFLAGNSVNTKDLFFKTAVRELEKLIYENRGKEVSDEIRYHLGILFLIKKEYGRSIEEFMHVINEEPKGIFDAKAHMKIGDINIDFLDNPEKGIEEYKKVTKEFGHSEVSAEASFKIAIFFKNRMYMYMERYKALKKFLENWKDFKEMKDDIKLAKSQSSLDLNKANKFKIEVEENFKKIITDYPGSIFQKKAENELSGIEKDYLKM